MKEYFAKTLTQVLEETSTNMGNAMVLDHLASKGSVTLEEAEFYHNIVTEVITEAAEDFIPDSIEVPEEVAPQMAEGEGEVFYDKAGNAYMFTQGQMVPVDGEAAGEIDPETAGAEVETAPQEAPQEEVVPVQESTVVGDDEKLVEESAVETPEASPEASPEVIEESTVVQEVKEELLEESDNVVARILANLK